MPFTPATKAQLQTAIAGWITGSINANTDNGGTPYGAMGTWDVTDVTDMSILFDIFDWASGEVIDVSSFNEDISGWNVSGVTNMSQMFQNCSSFNADISGWTVSDVIIMN